MTDTPEIDRLREQSWQGDGLPRHDTVFLLDAIQAVRDTEARVRHHYALSGRALREVGDAVRNSTLTDAQKVGVIAGVLANGPLDDGRTVHRCEWCGVSRIETPLEVTIREMEEARDDS